MYANEKAVWSLLLAAPARQQWR